MAESVPKLATTGEVARLLDVPLHRVQYIVRTRAHIQPSATAGGIRCFNDESVAKIRHELNSLDARRRGVGHG